MQPVNRWHAKTHLSKLIEHIVSAEDNEIAVARNGGDKPPKKRYNVKLVFLGDVLPNIDPDKALPCGM